MELSTITTFFSNPSGWGLLLLLALTIERLITGGYIKMWIGKKTRQEGRDAIQDERDIAQDKGNVISKAMQEGLLREMKGLSMHFNHETTAQYTTMIDGQKEMLEILRRIERDGIRIKQ